MYGQRTKETTIEDVYEGMFTVSHQKESINEETKIVKTTQWKL